MLEVEARDGAARIAHWRGEGLPLTEVPAYLWLAGDLPKGGDTWGPQLSDRPGPGVALVNTRSIQAPEAAASVSGTTLLLKRRLTAPPSVSADRPPLEAVGPLAVLPGALSLSRNPKRLAAALVEARRKAGFGRFLYAPGLGEPAHLALLVWAGIDVVDSVALSFAAARGRYLMPEGDFDVKEIAEAECICPACKASAPKDFDEASLLEHNLWAGRTELARVRNAIRAGRLRELCEMRARAHPEAAALLRRLDAQAAYFEERTPVTGRRTMWATTKESLRRPEVLRFRKRLLERYEPPRSASILVLLPCSARKPYSVSPSHRRFFRALDASAAARLCEEWMVTSPLGIVPRELERTYPAAHYDVPVTGEWDAEEGAIIRETFATLLSRRPWDGVVAHLPPGTLALVRDLLPPGTELTCAEGSPTKGENLGRLTAAIRTRAKDLPRPKPEERALDRLRGLASWQFGSRVADTLLQGATTRGRWPYQRLVGPDGVQRASLPPNRGLLSLTLEGAAVLARERSHWVEIEDFTPRGTVFAVGITDADAEIRVGEEVVVTRAGEVRAAGVATMTGAEMVEMERGEAVKVRHHA